MLTLIGASAGSGKTFTLARRYLELSAQPGPGAGFQRILGVTFTKKAAGEIRARIIRLLVERAAGAHETALSALTPAQAGRLLTSILHEYDQFQVTTIDAFFTRIVRSFAQDQELDNGFEIELDPAPLIQEAIGQLMTRIGDTDPELTTLVEAWVVERINEGKRWDMTRDLARLVSKTLSDRFQQLDRGTNGLPEGQAMTARQALAHYDQLKAEQARVMKALFEPFERLAELALELDLEQIKVNEANALFRPNLKRILEAAEGLESKCLPPLIEALGASDPARAIIEVLYKKPYWGKAPYGVVESRLIPALEVLFDRYTSPEYFGRYLTLGVLLKNYYGLQLTGLVSRELLKRSRENGVFLLHHVTDFLRQIVADHEAPFIYERVGAQLAHFLIDEMQDTSLYQWEAMRPLIVNGLSEGRPSLLVGDVKQAIYGFRGGTSELMLTGVEQDLGALGMGLERSSLQSNYRSMGRIVTFNNTFMPAALDKAAEMIMSLESPVLGPNTEDLEGITSRQASALRDNYSDLFQKLPDPARADRGYIEISQLRLTDENDEDPIDKRRGRAVIMRIASLQQAGYRAGQIGLLVRSNSEGQQLAYLFQEGPAIYADLCGRAGVLPDPRVTFAFTSADSLRLEASPALDLVVSLMRLVAHPEEALTVVHAFERYHVYTAGEPARLEALLLPRPDNDQALAERCLSYFDEPLRRSILRLQGRPALEVATDLIAVLDLGTRMPGQTPYVLSFLEQVQQHQSRLGPDLDTFLSFYQERGRIEALPLPPDPDRLVIQTIHKSKGLEYEAVVLPFVSLDINTGRGTDTVWAAGKELVPGIGAVPLNPGKKLLMTDFSQDYLEYRYGQILESLNTMYVALTRPRLALIVLVDQPKMGKTSASHLGQLPVLMQGFIDAPQSGMRALPLDPLDVPLPGVKPDLMRFAIGELEAPPEEADEAHAEGPNPGPYPAPTLKLGSWGAGLVDQGPEATLATLIDPDLGYLPDRVAATHILRTAWVARTLEDSLRFAYTRLAQKGLSNPKRQRDVVAAAARYLGVEGWPLDLYAGGPHLLRVQICPELLDTAGTFMAADRVLVDSGRVWLLSISHIGDPAREERANNLDRSRAVYAAMGLEVVGYLLLDIE